jgi:hypothetical protein
MMKQQHLSSNQLKMDQQEEAGMAAWMNILDVNNKRIHESDISRK